jgi:SAM-dependent methyltransferase
MNATLATCELVALKRRLKSMWMAGDYDHFSRPMAGTPEQLFQRLQVPVGARLLDVACGSGQLALIAARAGAVVTGIDIADNWIERARERARAQGLDIQFEQGDAEALPYEDGSFDFVVSLIGAMFAPRPELVASEMVRVCRPGGKIAMANWTAEGFVGKMFKTFAKHISAPGMPSPLLWGDESTVQERLCRGIGDLRLSRQHYILEYPFSPTAVVELFRNYYGPAHCAFVELDTHGQKALRADLEALWTKHNENGKNSTRVRAEYLEVLATRARRI